MFGGVGTVEKADIAAFYLLMILEIGKGGKVDLIEMDVRRFLKKGGGG